MLCRRCREFLLGLASGVPFLRLGSGFGTHLRVTSRLLLCSLCSILDEWDGLAFRISP